MPYRTLPRVDSVKPTAKPYIVAVKWRDGSEAEVDISGPVGTFRHFAPLRENPAMFAQVAVGEWGSHLVWPGEIEMAANTIWRLHQEQSGKTISGEDFRAWRQKKAYTQEAAAKALGISRRMVVYYEDGVKPVPRTVALATRGLDAGPVDRP